MRSAPGVAGRGHHTSGVSVPPHTILSCTVRTQHTRSTPSECFETAEGLEGRTVDITHLSACYKTNGQFCVNLTTQMQHLRNGYRKILTNPCVFWSAQLLKREHLIKTHFRRLPFERVEYNRNFHSQQSLLLRDTFFNRLGRNAVKLTGQQRAQRPSRQMTDDTFQVPNKDPKWPTVCHPLCSIASAA